MPGILYLLASLGRRISKSSISTKDIFLAYTGSLLPVGLLLWMAFVIPMLFVNITFILQSLSDPFGWGWDFFGTANIPWHQFIPQYIPWLQAILVLVGLYLSLRNIKRTWQSHLFNTKQVACLSAPIGVFLVMITIASVLFFTN
jgi:hypothetical protein